MRCCRNRRWTAWLLAGLLGACATEGSPADEADSDILDSADAGSSLIQDHECPDDSPLRYQNFGAPFFYAYCTGCHSAEQKDDMRQGAPLHLNFETLDKIRDQAVIIYNAAADTNDKMPPTGGPEALARQRLADWLACGAPD